MAAGGQVALGESQEGLRTLERTLQSSTPVIINPFDLTGIQSSPIFDYLRSYPRFREIVREVAVRRQEIREQVRRLGIDIYPAGAEPDSVSAATGG